MKYKVWHIGKEEFIQDYAHVYVGPDGDVFEIDEGTYGYMYKNVITDGVKVVRYTGMKDRNGVEIYEGDILSDSKGCGEVQWFQEHCGFKIYSNYPYAAVYNLEADSQLRYSEVIGNIYEHPHLLPKEEEPT